MSRPTLLWSVCACWVAACGGRTVGVTYDGGTVPDGGSGGDATVGPDASAWTCHVDSEPVVVYDEGTPGFVMSLDRMGERGYVLGGAAGWGDIQAGLWWLDAATLETRSVLWLSGRMAWARYDRDSDTILVVMALDDRAQLQRYALGTGAAFELRETFHLCETCAPAWSSPLLGEGHAAVAVRDLSENTFRVVFYESGASLFVETESMPGTTPHLVWRTDGPFLIYTRDRALFGVPYSWDGEALADPISLVQAPVQAVLTAESGVGGESWAAILAGSTEEPAFWLLHEGEVGTAERLLEVPGMVPYALEGHLSDNGESVAFAWGETFGEGRVGPHVLVVDRVTGAIDFGPALIDGPAGGAASYSVWAAVAPHPLGYAVVWGGWREEGLYGIYGKVLGCE